jgi:myo-inositol catabolism protein IolC
MIAGYTEPLYVLPFDHRGTYVSGLFGWKEPLNVEQMVAVAQTKQIIYAGFEQAISDHVPSDRIGILVDEQFGSAILRDAVSKGYITAVPVEKTGQDEFDFIYGDDFGKHIEALHPTFAKVLVRYNPGGDAALNQRQVSRLHRLSDYLQQIHGLFLFELLVPATPTQLEEVGGDKNAFDLQLRPQLMLEAVQALQDTGVEPDIWKVEGLDRREDCVELADMAHRGGRDAVGLIVLGRGADRQRVVHWLKTASSVPGYIGFAVGRSTWLQSLTDVQANRISRKEAATQIAGNFEEWIRVFEEARSSMRVAI